MPLNVLVTGGSGTLGQALRKIRPEWKYPSSAEFDVLNPSPIRPDVILHAAAYTDVLRAEGEMAQVAWTLNVDGTARMARLGVPLIYISTEYVFGGRKGDYAEDDPHEPVNWYGRTKSEGEDRAFDAPRALILRTLFKPEPFPHPRACIDQWTSGDGVSVIAPMIVRCVDAFVEGAFGRYDTIHVGTERKSTFEIARKSRPDVKECRRADIPLPLPRDTTLNCGKYQSMFGEI